MGTYALAHSLFTVVSGVLSPFVGRALVTRGRSGVAIRSVMLLGAVSLGLGLLAISRAPSAGLAALAFGSLVAPGTILMGPLVGQTLVTNWFEARRGRALGLVAAGTTIGGVVMPPIAATLIDTVGWQDAMELLGFGVFALPLPLIAFCVVSSPEDVGERPDGLGPEAVTEGVGDAGPRGARALLGDRDLWLAGLFFGLMFTSGTISVVFSVPYASQLGLPLVGGALIISLRSGFAALGKILLGTLSDRVGVRPVLWGIAAVQITLTSLLIQTRNPWLFTLYGVGLGFVGGAVLPLKGALAGQLFGRASFASAMGLLQSLAMPFSLFLVPAGGLVYDWTGDYAWVFGGTIPLLVLAALLLCFVDPERPAARRAEAGAVDSDQRDP